MSLRTARISHAQGNSRKGVDLLFVRVVVCGELCVRGGCVGVGAKGAPKETGGPGAAWGERARCPEISDTARKGFRGFSLGFAGKSNPAVLQIVISIRIYCTYIKPGSKMCTGSATVCDCAFTLGKMVQGRVAWRRRVPAFLLSLPFSF